MAWLTLDKVQEYVGQVEDAFDQADSVPHPFLLHGKAVAKAIGRITSSVTVDNVIYDERFTELPIEEQKRQEAAALGKAYRVPEWWRGEKANYKIAQVAMKTVPKNIGPVK